MSDRCVTSKVRCADKSNFNQPGVLRAGRRRR
jgi:hypothetical protein